MNLELFSFCIKIATGIVTCSAFTFAVLQYRRSRKDVKAKQFLDLRNSFRENEKFQNIIEHLYTDKNFTSITNSQKIEFMSAFEDLAFLVNSGLLKKDVAYYMFGGDAITAWRDDKFWHPSLRTDERWGLLNVFVREMLAIDENFKFSRYQSKIRL